jgi:hypothetical protein
MLFLVGLGGAGSKIVEGFYKKNLGDIIVRFAGREEKDVSGVAVDTSQALSGLNSIPPENRVVVGKGLTKGHGTGGDVELGSRILSEEYEVVISALGNAGFGGASAVFIISGLGGGTGTGGFPILAGQVRKAFNVPVYGIVTIPSRSEGVLYSKNAYENFSAIRKSVSGLIVLDNGGPATLGAVVNDAYKKVNAAVRDFLRGFDAPTLKKSLQGDTATIGLAQAKAEPTALKSLMSGLLRNSVYFPLKHFQCVHAVLRGGGGKIYGERFAQEWIKSKYGAELRFKAVGPENQKQMFLYTLITGITGISDRLAVDTKPKKVSSELESLLKDIKSL